MWRFFFTIFLVSIVIWAIVDVVYWGSSDAQRLFPDRRYLTIVIITGAVAALLWGLFWGLRKMRSSKKR